MHEECGVLGIWSPCRKNLAYLSVDAAQRLGGESARFCCDGCFTGRYPIDIPEDQGKSKFETPINGNHE